MSSLFRALKKGYNPVYIFNKAIRRGEAPKVHGLDPSIINAQAEALNIPLIQREATWDTYEHVFKELKESTLSKKVNFKLKIKKFHKYNSKSKKMLIILKEMAVLE